MSMKLVEEGYPFIMLVKESKYENGGKGVAYNPG